MKTTVIHHSADFDGLFCREIARKFLPDAELIGWDFKDAPLTVPEGNIYILDLPVDRVFGFEFKSGQTAFPIQMANVVWIDHHKSAIESHPKEIPGYRIDGVAACRLAWHWFTHKHRLGGLVFHTETDGHFDASVTLPDKIPYVNRTLIEPLAVRLAGEYDIWDKRDSNAELFQHGLRSEQLDKLTWSSLLSAYGDPTVERLLMQGKAVQYAKTQENSDIIVSFGVDVMFEGMLFLACNHARFNSHLFTAGLKPEHDACLGFNWTGKNWRVSLYHAPGKEHHDLSLIAVKYGGGGHKGACGFVTNQLPFLP